MKERKLALMLERLVSNYHIIFLVSVSNRLGLSCLFVILFCVFIWYCFETVLKCSRHRNKKTKPLAIFHHFAVLVCMLTVQLYLPVCVLYSSICLNVSPVLSLYVYRTDLSACMCTIQIYLPVCVPYSSICLNVCCTDLSAFMCTVQLYLPVCVPYSSICQKVCTVLSLYVYHTALSAWELVRYFR